MDTLEHPPVRAHCQVCEDKKWVNLVDAQNHTMKVPCFVCNKDGSVNELADSIVKLVQSKSAHELEQIVTRGRQAMAKMQRAKPLPAGFELKEFYEVYCPYCASEFKMKPGLHFKLGMNSGQGSCLACRKFFFIVLDVETNTAQCEIPPQETADA